MVLAEQDQNQLLDEPTLRARYKEMMELRETKPEREAARMFEAMEKAKETSNAVIRSLRAELAEHCKHEEELSQAVNLADTLQKENDALRAQLKEANAHCGGKITCLPSSDKVRAFYETLTGLRVRLEGDTAHCTLGVSADHSEDACAQNSISFQLELATTCDERGEEISYLPTDLTMCGDRIPEYLREEITCEHVFERLICVRAQASTQQLTASVCHHTQLARVWLPLSCRRCLQG